MTRLLPYISALSLIILLLFLAGVLQQRGVHEVHSSKDPLIGQILPEFSLPETSESTGLDSRDFPTDGPVVVHFFSSWCQLCEKDHHLLSQLAKQGPHIHLYGVVIGDDPMQAAAWLKKHRNPYKAVGIDRYGDVTGPLFHVSGVPDTIVIGRDRKIIAHFRGPLSKKKMEKALYLSLSS